MNKLWILLLLFNISQGSILGDNLKNLKNAKHSKHSKHSNRTELEKNSKKVIKTAKKYLGKKYKFGGFDCSKFTQIVMKKNGINLPRTAAKQSKIGTCISRPDLKAGDLIFFQGTSKHARISHVGIMISQDRFIHASSKAGKVVISKISKYYGDHFYTGRRLTV